MSYSRRRGQTAIEVLFVLAIILVGGTIVISSYMGQNRAVSILTYVRTSASDACAYLNSGVITNESVYSPLNPIINLTNYSFKSFQLAGVGMNESSDIIQITVRISYFGSSLEEDTVADAIRRYIEGDLVLRTNVVNESGKLYFGGREIKINVEVVRK